MDKRTDVINIAEILKDKKVDTKLYSPILGKYFLKNVDIKLQPRFPITVKSKNNVCKNGN